MFSFLCASALLFVSTFAQSGNPFTGKTFYVQQTYVNEVQNTINMYPDNAALLSQAQNVSVAYWIDSISRIDNVTTVLEGAKAQQASSGHDVLVFFIIYDLPDRDCAALASNGEIHCANDACADGINQYKTQYIDPIIALFQKYPSLTIVALVEPDSLPNLATNANIPKCSQAKTAYMTGVTYAINQLATISNVHIYVDAAHGGWLGWANNMQKFVAIMEQIFQGVSGGASKVRGFATNTANYQPLMSVTSTADPCRLKSQGNNCINEAIYIQFMSQEMGSIRSDFGFITDTSRNGVIDERSDCSNWCNIKNSGLHFFPTSETSSSGIPQLIDAFFWVKVPGESDGTSDTSASNYDAHCGSADSYKPSPQAGLWNAPFFLMLAKNSVPPLS